MKAYFIIRKDLNMSPAKLAVQVGHGVCKLFMNSALKEPLNNWLYKSEMKKIVVSIDNADKLKGIWLKLVQDKFFAEEIYDNGYTEFNGFTYTGIVLLVAEDDVPNYIKRLRLYK